MSQEINCSNFESRINDILDLRLNLDSDDGLNRHAAKCADCKKIYDDYAALDDSLSNVIWDVATLANLTAPSVTTVSRHTWLVGSLAALLLLGASLFYGLNQTENRTPTQLADLAAPVLRIVQPARTDNSVELADPSNDQPGEVDPSLQTAGTRTAPSWDEISEQFFPLSSYYLISAELPGVRPFQSSLNVTIDWVQQTIQRLSSSSSQKPGLGRVIRQTQIPVA